MFSYRPFILVFALMLAACGEPAPQGWNANLDVTCKPQDPFDKISAILSSEKFWRLAEYDLGTMEVAGLKNQRISQSILDDSRAQRGQFFSRAEEAARELGLTGSARREHVQRNMDRYEAEVKDIEERLGRQREALSWINRCMSVVERELRAIGLRPIPYDPANRPR